MSFNNSFHADGLEVLKAVIVSVMLVLAVALIFGQTTRYEMTVCDDDPYVYGNPYVLAKVPGNPFKQPVEYNTSGLYWAFTDARAGNWHPLTWLSHMVDANLYGVNEKHPWAGPEAGGHHLTSVLLHAASSVLLFLTLRLMTGAFWPSALVAAMFAVHPMRVESVAWVAERKDVLSGLFWMLTLLSYGLYVRAAGAGPFVEVARFLAWKGVAKDADSGSLAAYFGRIACLYLLVVVAFGCGLMSKSMLVTLPCVLALLDFWPLGRWRAEPFPSHVVRTPPRRWSEPADALWFQRGWLIVEKLPLLAMSAAVCVIIVETQQRAGAMSMSKVVPFGVRVANAATSYLVYLWKTLWPTNLAICYPYPDHVDLEAGEATRMILYGIVAALALAVATFLFVWAARRRPWLPVGWFWYLGTLVPVIGIIRVGIQLYADRYTYLPMIGIYLMVAWSAAELVRRHRALAAPVAAGVAALLTWWIAAAFVQTSTWRDSTTVFAHAVRVTPRDYFSHNHLGLSYHSRYREYLEEAQKALDEKDTARAKAAKALADHELERAGAEYKKAVEFGPNYDSAVGNLGVYYSLHGNLDEAIKYFRHAADINPYLMSFRGNLAMAYFQQNKLRDAEEVLRESFKTDPTDSRNHGYLKVILYKQGRIAEAIAEQHREMVCLEPNNPETLNNAAWYLATVSDDAARSGDDAVQFAEKAVQIAGDDVPGILGTLAAAYAEVGRFSDAVDTARRAVKNARQQNQWAMAKAIEDKIPLYQARRPYREPAPRASHNNR